MAFKGAEGGGGKHLYFYPPPLRNFFEGIFWNHYGLVIFFRKTFGHFDLIFRRCLIYKVSAHIFTTAEKWMGQKNLVENPLFFLPKMNQKYGYFRVFFQKLREVTFRSIKLK